MRLNLPKLLLIFSLALGYLFVISPDPVQAVINDFCFTKTACWTDPLTGLRTCDTLPSGNQYYGGYCDNGTFNPWCERGTDWKFWYPSCDQINFSCEKSRWENGECGSTGTTTCTWQQQNCPTSDSCTARQPYLNPGLCQPSNWDNIPANAGQACQIGPTIYKTCCNSDGTVDGNCNGGNYTGTCPSGTTTVFCGFGGYPACGEPACQSIAPPPTPPPPPPGTCSDGTARNTCSSTQPLYCNNNGNLTNSCGTCGCPGGQTCQADGTCTTTGGGGGPTCNFDSSYNQCCADGYSQYVNAGTWSDGSGNCWETGPCNQVDAACSSGVIVRYGCNGSSCVRDDVNGNFTTPNCNNACGGPRYGCSGGSCVRDDTNGSYTSSDCNNSCNDPCPGGNCTTGSRLCPVMHPFAQIRNVTKGQEFPSSVTYKGVTYNLTSPGACRDSGPSCGLAIESTAQSINASPGDVLELRVMEANENDRSGAIHSVGIRFWGDKGITAYPNGLADDEAGNGNFCTNSYFNGLTNFANARIYCISGGSMGCYPICPGCLWVAETEDRKSSPGEPQAWSTGVVSTNWNNAYYQVGAEAVPGTIAGITAVAYPISGIQTPSGQCFWENNGSQSNKDFRWKTDDPMCPFTNDMFYDSLPLTVRIGTYDVTGWVRNSQTRVGIPNVEIQVYDDTFGKQTQKTFTDARGYWIINNFVRLGDFYAVRVTGNLANPKTAPTGYVAPAKTSTIGWTWNWVFNPNPPNNPQADTPLGSPSYEGQKAGSGIDCAGPDGSTPPVSGRCSFVYDPPPAPTASITGPLTAFIDQPLTYSAQIFNAASGTVFVSRSDNNTFTCPPGIFTDSTGRNWCIIRTFTNGTSGSIFDANFTFREAGTYVIVVNAYTNSSANYTADQATECTGSPYVSFPNPQWSNCGPNDNILTVVDSVPAPGPNPWIQTFGGDVHSNTRINTPGGP